MHMLSSSSLIMHFIISVLCTLTSVSFYCVATVYGKGVYFAHDASYSARDQYSPRDINNNKYIFLAKVLTGEFAVGSSSYVTPPPKGSNSLTLYDSVVDNVSNPSIFVIFGDAQAYPDYLITFT